MSTDALFNTDEHGKSKELTTTEKDIFQIMHLLDMKPGTDSVNPEKGINIRSFVWRNDDAAVLELKETIKSQVSKYTDIILSTVEIMVKRNRISIGIQLPTMDDLIVFTVVDGQQQIMLDQISMSE